MVRALTLLEAGQCVALPTETVYGLAADATNELALEKIFTAKGRPKNHPLIVHLASAKQLEQWACDIPNAAYKLAKAFWPGPLTLLLKKAPDVNNVVTGGLTTIGLRVPSHPLFLNVLEQFGKGLAAPSANRYKQLSPTSAEQVINGLNGRIDAVLEGGICEHGLESTIIDLVSETPRVLRAGPITTKQLEQVLGFPVATPESHIEVVPGNVKAHYQPNTPVKMMTEKEILALVDCEEVPNMHVIMHSQALSQTLTCSLKLAQLTLLPNNAKEYGKALYGTLYRIDKLGTQLIVVQLPPTKEEWRAVNDRLSRAAC
ncbi:L-threonylcarbamoyladenylate synthase [Pseudoalteromonas sp.]|uniref:L-threonylcarbamoyladenylate synthase n=1 Tax=Pseudoalteromonas sp. TaxID=53249 RepID=UPI0035660FE0